MILLGEVGGTEEYKVIEAVKSGKITKAIIAWCIGTIAKYYDSGVQFGHAGASANADSETAEYKNNAMAEAGIHVPASFNDLPAMINKVFTELNVAEIPEPEMNTVPAVRRSKEFICTISDDRGEECTYAGFPISSVATLDTGKGIGDVISLLWFKKQ
jgi:ATP-citrate lyase alpha-subunit